MCFLLFYAGFATSPGHRRTAHSLLYQSYELRPSFSVATSLATPCLTRRPQPSALPDSWTRSVVLLRLRFVPSVCAKEARSLSLTRLRVIQTWLCYKNARPLQKKERYGGHDQKPYDIATTFKRSSSDLKNNNTDPEQKRQHQHDE
jgi:hypothetical protein